MAIYRRLVPVEIVNVEGLSDGLLAGEVPVAVAFFSLGAVRLGTEAWPCLLPDQAVSTTWSHVVLTFHLPAACSLASGYNSERTLSDNPIERSESTGVGVVCQDMLTLGLSGNLAAPDRAFIPILPRREAVL
jgi:hypothetical protein